MHQNGAFHCEVPDPNRPVARSPSEETQFARLGIRVVGEFWEQFECWFEAEEGWEGFDYTAVAGAVAKQKRRRRRRWGVMRVLLWWLGGLILVEGLALATSGFLPDEWDKLFMKYLYPSFTPTVLLFIAGTTAYGVIKYLQNEELKGQK